MDLDQMRNTKQDFDHLDPEDKAEVEANGSQAKGFLARGLPAVPETDRAAFAWFMSETIRGLGQIPAGELGDVIEDSAAAYAMAAISLLGWNDL